MDNKNLFHNQPEKQEEILKPIHGIPLDKRLFLYDQIAKIKPLLDEKQREAIKRIECIPEEIIEGIREKKDDPIPLYAKEEKQALDMLENIPDTEVEKILEMQETKLFLLEKPENEHASDAKRVLITLADPGAWAGIAPLIQKLQEDPRCGAILLMSHGKGGQAFIANMGGDENFAQIRNLKGSKDLMLADAMQSAKNAPFDIEIATLTTDDGPDRVVLYGGKEAFGKPTTKTYLVVETWSGARLFTPSMKPVDGIFCNDELARALIIKNNPEIVANTIYQTGTGQTDVPAKEEIPAIETKGREKLGVEDDEYAILFLGTPWHDYKETVKKPNGEEVALQRKVMTRKDFERTLFAVFELAKLHPDQKFALVCRPHPREAEPEMYAEVWEAQPISAPENLKLVNGSRDVCTIDEAAYISKAITGPLCTEHYKGAFQRKIPSFIALFKDEPGLTGDAMYAGLNDESLQMIAEASPELLKPVYYKEAMTQELEYVYTRKDCYEEKKNQRPARGEGSASKIADIIFAKHDQS